MFKDIRLSVDNKKINYKYNLVEDKIIIKPITDLETKSILKIFYDENIYEIKLNKDTKFDLGSKGEIYIHIDSKEFTFRVVLKNNYFVKSVFKYINKFIDKDTLINEINLFLNSKVGEKYRKDLEKLLASIKNEDKDIEDLILNNEDEYQRIYNLLINNITYITIAKNMSDLELMLLITSYIFAPYTPKIDQKTFNDLVNAAKNYDNALENIWRLGMNYDCKNYDYSLLDDFFVNSKDVRYLGEYISCIHQINQENIINKILETKDKKYIKQILASKVIIDSLDKKYQSILEKY